MIRIRNRFCLIGYHKVKFVNQVLFCFIVVVYDNIVTEKAA